MTHVGSQHKKKKCNALNADSLSWPLLFSYRLNFGQLHLTQGV